MKSLATISFVLWIAAGMAAAASLSSGERAWRVVKPSRG